MTKITQQDINNEVWKACDTFRSSIDPSIYKDYILTMLFIKYVSDVNDDKYDAYLKKYNGDKLRADRAMKTERFVVRKQAILNTSTKSETKETSVKSLTLVWRTL